MLAGESFRQHDGNIEVAALGADLQLVAAVGETQTVLVEAFLGFTTKGIQVAKMELEVTQVVGGNSHAHSDGIGSSIALGYDTSAANLTANLIGTGYICREVVTAQSTLSTIVGLGLKMSNRRNRSYPA